VKVRKRTEVLDDGTRINTAAIQPLRTTSTTNIKNRIRNFFFMGTKIKQE
jgi:hypothetical protein